MNKKTSAVSGAMGALVFAALLGGVAHYKHLSDTTSPIPLADVPTPAVKPDPATVPRHVASLEVSAEAMQLIMDNEGLELKPYKFRGAWYIGYGHGRTARPDMEITAEDAITLLRDDLRHFEKQVRALVKVPLTQGQFSALVSFAYNCGPGTLAKSSVLRHINNGEMDEAADALMLYTKAKVNGEYRELASLKRRRTGERRIFLGLQDRKITTLRT